MRALLLLALFTAAALLPVVLAGNASAQTGVGVWNSPPTFTSIDLRDDNEVITLIINVSDYNGWGDLFQVTVEITDQDRVPIQQAVFQQYATNTSTVRIDRFDQPISSPNLYLDVEMSRVTRYPGTDWYNENNTLGITFVFRPFGGTYIHIKAEDKRGLYAVHDGPFTPKYVGVDLTPPFFGEDTVVPLAISTTVATVGGAAAVVDRRGSNKMARRIERMRRRGGGL